jgi:putative phosphoesterase
MKVSILSDIHSNLSALESVLQDIPTDIDQIIACGDIIGYGPKPRQCVNKIIKNGDICIKGNHEKALLNGERFNASSARYGLKHTREQLYSKHFNWIEGLQDSIETTDTLICHSHPDPDIDDHIYPKNIEDSFSEYFENNDILIYGHTHIPVVKNIHDTLVVNPGSVGQPRDNNTKASYAIVNLDTFESEIRRIQYDIDQTIDNMHKYNFPKDSISRIKNAE